MWDVDVGSANEAPLVGVHVYHMHVLPSCNGIIELCSGRGIYFHAEQPGHPDGGW